jgi:GNAT superfamily N-acetyltransferase
MTADLVIHDTLSVEAPSILDISHSVDVFESEDIETVEELLRDYFRDGASKSGYYFLSAIQNSEVVGFACFGPRALTEGTFDLFWICSRKGAQGKGVGGALLEQVEADVIMMGGRLIVLETSTLPGYAPARRFYETHRYRCEGIIEDFYKPGDGLVLFSKKIR